MMRRPLFLRIVDALGEWNPFFTLRFDATITLGYRQSKNALLL
jgi:hypothetical protein